MYLIFVLYALFASVFTIAKAGLAYTQPLFFVGSRMLIAGILMLGYLFFFDRKQLKINKKTVFPLVRLALFNIYLTNIFEFWGLKHLTSFKTCFIYSLCPFLSAIFSYLMLSETLSRKKFIGLMVGFLGFIPILVSQGGEGEKLGYLFFVSWAELAVMMAAASSVLGWIFLRQLVNDHQCPPVFANAASMLIGGAMALAHSLVVEDWSPVPVTEYLPFIECAIALIIISNFICYNLYGYLLKRFSATFLSFAGFTTPLFTALFGWFYLGEIVTAPFYLSAAVVFFGLLLFHQEEFSVVSAETV